MIGQQITEIHRDRDSVETMTLEAGTIGWNDQEEWVDFGSNDNDGHTLIRVQLFRGRDMTQPTTPDEAQGYQIVCQLGSLAGSRVLKKGTKVLVGFPSGFELGPGCGIILQSIEPTRGMAQFQKDRVVQDYGDDVHLVIKAKSISLQDPDGRYIAVGTPRGGGDPGIYAINETGTGFTAQGTTIGIFSSDGSPPDAKTMIQMTPDGMDFLQKGSTNIMIKLKDGQIVQVAKSIGLAASSVTLGATASMSTPVLYGFIGVAGAPSTSVFVSV